MLRHSDAAAAGRVTRHLIERVAAQVCEHRVVVWYDPGGEYAAVAEGLASDAALLPPGAVLEREDGSFFALRRRLEPLISAPEPPLLLVSPSPGRP